VRSLSWLDGVGFFPVAVWVCSAVPVTWSLSEERFVGTSLTRLVVQVTVTFGLSVSWLDAPGPHAVPFAFRVRIWVRCYVWQLIIT
jgi:hypothetical protein